MVDYNNQKYFFLIKKQSIYQGKSVGAIVLVVRPCDRLCFTRTEEGRKERIRGNQVQSVTCLQLLHDWLLYEEGKE